MLIKKHLCLLLPAVLLTACGGSSDEDAQLAPSFSLAVSDAPVDDLSAVVVCFNQVELKRSETSGGDLTFTVGEDVGTIAANDLCLDHNDQVIANTVGINLLEYTGSDSIALVDGVTIEAGDYSQLRLKMSEGSYGIDTTTDEKISISVPSNELKLDGFTAALGGAINFTLEFDLRKAMTNPIGQSDYFLKPRGVRLVDNNEVGHITGTVTETLLIDNQCTVTPADISVNVASVYLYPVPFTTELDLNSLSDNGGIELNQALTSTGVTYDGAASYNFEIGFVNAGQYTIAISCDVQDDPEVDETVTFIQALPVTVTADNNATLVEFDTVL